MLADKFKDLGLEIRVDKTEVGACAGDDRATMQTLDGFEYRDHGNITLLGATLGTEE